MSRLIPHPLLSVVLVIFWMMLTAFSPGYFLLGSALALFAGWAMSALHPTSARIHGWRFIPKLIWVLFVDIIRSNIAVVRLILTEGRNDRSSAFIIVPLKITNPNSLAVLAFILTATPGTAWLEYSSTSGKLILHIFDASEAEHYRKAIVETYEPLLMEIFE